jgi:phosphoribosylglycinamide formyltransferase-1
MKPLNIIVLISGNGSNLQAIVDAKNQGHLNVNIQAVISNCADAYGLTRAAKANISTQIIRQQDYQERDLFEAALIKAIDGYRPDLIVLAGFMRRLGANLVRKYSGMIINIHPSLLPKYPGLHTHSKVLQAGDAYHGTSIHFVTEEIDAGPLISQARLKVSPRDDEDSLKSRVQQLEHHLYPETLQWFAEGRVQLVNGQVLIDNKPAALSLENGH